LIATGLFGVVVVVAFASLTNTLASTLGPDIKSSLQNEVASGSLTEIDYYYGPMGIVDSFTDCMSLSVFQEVYPEDNSFQNSLRGGVISGCSNLVDSLQSDETSSNPQVPRFWHTGSAIIQVGTWALGLENLKLFMAVLTVIAMVGSLWLAKDSRARFSILTMFALLALHTDLISFADGLYKGFQWATTMLLVFAMTLVARSGSRFKVLVLAAVSGAIGGVSFWFTDILTLPALLSFIVHISLTSWRDYRDELFAAIVAITALCGYFLAWSLKWVISIPVIGFSSLDDATAAILTRTGDQAWEPIYWYSGLVGITSFAIERPNFAAWTFVASMILSLALVSFGRFGSRFYVLFLVLIVVGWGLTAKQHVFIHAEVFTYKQISVYVAIIIGLWAGHVYQWLRRVGFSRARSFTV
jgi:hypothetical protein